MRTAKDLHLTIISPSFPSIKCGVGDVVAQLCQALAGVGISVSVITSQDERINKDSCKNRVDILPIVRKWNLSALPPILASLKKKTPNVVNIQYETNMYGGHWMVNFLPFFIKLLSHKCGVVSTIHELWEPRILAKIPFPRYIGVRALIRYSDKIIVTDESTQEELKKIWPPCEAKVFQIPLGTPIQPAPVEISIPQKTRASLNVSEDETLLSYFGFLRKDKNIEAILSTLKKLLNKGRKVKLLIIGGEGDIGLSDKNSYRFELGTFAQELEIAPFILWKDYCAADEVAHYLQSSDICILSFDGGVSYKRTSFIAALSLGLPIITTQGESMPDGLKNGENALLVPCNDIEAIVKAVEKLMDSKDLRSNLGKGAKNLARRFSWSKIAAQTIKVLEMAGEV